MKSVKEMDERQQLLYYKLKSRIFDIAMVELMLGLIIWSVATIRIEMVAILTFIPLTYYRFKLFSIFDAKDIEIHGEWFLFFIWLAIFGGELMEYSNRPELYQWGSDDMSLLIIRLATIICFFVIALSGTLIKHWKMKKQEDDLD